FLSGRDYHGLHHENPDFQFAPVAIKDGLVSWQPYRDSPVILAGHNGRYEQRPEWFRNFLYRQERERGLEFSEDLASPGAFRWDLQAAPAVWLLTLDSPLGLTQTGPVDDRFWAVLSQRETQRRAQFVSPSTWGADAYLTRRGTGQTIIAGYPWFTDWGRDTFIALRGLCLATGRLPEARQILLAWSKCVSKGMLPNRFPDSGRVPEYNSVDAALWFIVAVFEFLDLASSTNLISDAEELDLLEAVEEILRGYHDGTRFGIRCDTDGLLACGQEGVALTWMDARVGEWTVTPRIGKPVEIQALWINALRIGESLELRGQDWQTSQASFLERFWLDEQGHLADVVDNGLHAGEVDTTLRPNQLLAVGGLPFPLLEGDRARRLVDTVQSQLWTPVGMRTLTPQHPDYRGHLIGDMRERDAAYHQGTAWPWLLGPFVEAWVRVRGDSSATRQAARQQFLAPLLASLENSDNGPLHIPEIVDGDSPHTSRGCPFQAWSLGEYLRLDLDVLA
ncbi:MAG: glycogen debranching protein, partial [Planctomycetaceae bacterium]|nr:glycogen debranching protein [Planctomycetaceae bacterium]